MAEPPPRAQGHPFRGARRFPGDLAVDALSVGLATAVVHSVRSERELVGDAGTKE